MKLSSNRTSKDKPQAERKNTQAKAAKKNQPEAKGAGKAKKVVLALAIIVALGAAAFIGTGVYAGGIEQIFPNVSLEGIDLSNMTITQAAEVLGKSSLFYGAQEELEVALPADITLKVNAKSAGSYISAADAAVFAYDYCHADGFVSNTTTYLRCVFGGVGLSVADLTQLDEEYLQKTVNEAARQVNLALLESSVELDEETQTISVIKGGGGVQLDAEKLYDEVKAALESGSLRSFEYTAVTANGQVEEIDLERLYDTIFTEPVSAVYDPETKSATQSVEGRSFDINEARKTWDKTDIGGKVLINLIVTEPEITTEKLNSMLFADLLAQKSTTLSGSSYARINNITKASAAINGLVMNPGDEFSYNGVVGQRTAEGGYMSAGAYNNGQVVSEVGGGICQVSSTLYYCALISNLEITYRMCHMFGVDYLPTGLDATVSWPAPDFKFKNDGEYPIRIDAYVDTSTNTCVIKIYGSNPDGISVEMTTEQHSYTDGYGATSYRWVYDKDGNLLSKTKEATSRYYYKKAAEDPSPSPEPSPSPAVTPSPDIQPSPGVSEQPSTEPPVSPPDPETPPTGEPVDPPTLPPDPGTPVEP